MGQEYDDGRSTYRTGNGLNTHPNPPEGREKKRPNMKKIYFSPEMEVVDIEMQQQVLAGSLGIDSTDISDENELLAPEMDIFNL